MKTSTEAGYLGVFPCLCWVLPAMLILFMPGRYSVQHAVGLFRQLCYQYIGFLFVAQRQGFSSPLCFWRGWKTIGSAGGGAPKKALALSIERSKLLAANFISKERLLLEQRLPVYGLRGN